MSGDLESDAGGGSLSLRTRAETATGPALKAYEKSGARRITVTMLPNALLQAHEEVQWQIA
jgi:hypothetical protein